MARDAPKGQGISVRPVGTVDSSGATLEEVTEMGDEAQRDQEGGENVEEEEEEKEPEEGRVAKGITAPKGPTAKEREEHERTHIPYRSWRKYCVQGRGGNKPHRRMGGEQGEGEEEKQVHRVCMDYGFLSKKDKAQETNPMIVMIDDNGAVYGRIVGQKGVGENREMEWLIRDMNEELDSWGHRGKKLIIKSDQEVSIEALQKAVADTRSGETIPELAPRGESQSNGRAEDAVRRIREYARVLKEQLEDKIQDVLDPGDCIMQWLVRWAALLITLFSVGTDGKSAYERIRGKRCKTEVIRFGEKVRYKQLKGVDSGGTMDSSWHEGVWLGHNRNSSEIIIGTPDGVVAAWAVKRLPVEEQWDAQAVKGMTGTPGATSDNRPTIKVPIQVRFDDRGPEEPDEVRERKREEGPRNIYTRAKDLKDKYGYTVGCEGCMRAKAGRRVVGPRTHTPECRARVEKAMAEDDQDRERVQKYQERITEFLEERVEEEDGRNVKRARREGEQAAGSQEQAAGSQGGGEPAEGNQAMGEQAAGGEQKRDRENEEGGTEQENKRNRVDSGGVEQMMTGMAVEYLKGVDVAEIYSPERVCKEAAKFGLKAGWSVDLLNGTDLWEKERKGESRAVPKTRETFVIGREPNVHHV